MRITDKRWTADDVLALGPCKEYTYERLRPLLGKRGKTPLEIARSRNIKATVPSWHIVWFLLRVEVLGSRRLSHCYDDINFAWDDHSFDEDRRWQVRLIIKRLT